VEKPSEPVRPRWGQERRLAFIDTRLQYDGKINRRDLQEFFDISTPQASSDLETYKTRVGANLHYDGRERAYLAAPTFSPLSGRSSATNYLDDLYRLASQVIEPSESFVGFVPPTGVVATPARAIAATEVATLVRAIRDHTAHEIIYQSMNVPEPVNRIISPHAIGFDGLRWHVRAWCHQRHAFRDFAIGRMEVLREVTDLEIIDPAADHGWTTHVGIVLVPHPALSPSQRTAIIRDYGMADDKLVLPCRKAMLFYTLRHLNLQSKKISDDPATQHVIVENRNEVERWIEEDRALSLEL
jgi:hypothetical protein